MSAKGSERLGTNETVGHVSMQSSPQGGGLRPLGRVPLPMRVLLQDHHWIRPAVAGLFVLLSIALSTYFWILHVQTRSPIVLQAALITPFTFGIPMLALAAVWWLWSGKSIVRRKDFRAPAEQDPG